MANQQHIDILKQGADYWNFWRTEKVILKPDLSNANFSSVYLQGVDLSQANCSGVNFNSAYLHEANFIRADLSGAIFRYANCSNSCFSEAKLIGTDFYKAVLTHANLSGADPRYAKFFETLFGHTSFANLNLSLTEALNTSFHKSTSFITNQTLEKSGFLSKSFLKGVGLTDWEIQKNKLYQPDHT